VLLARRYLEPLLDTSVLVLPHAYRDVAAAEGTALVLRVSELGRDASALAWTLRREHDRWRIYRGESEHATAQVTGSADAIWRLLFNALAPDEASDLLIASGPAELVAPLWRARSVMV
jgi:hypothetical protein